MADKHNPITKLIITYNHIVVIVDMIVTYGCINEDLSVHEVLCGYSYDIYLSRRACTQLLDCYNNLQWKFATLGSLCCPNALQSFISEYSDILASECKDKCKVKIRRVS
jgi:hypothetical protein